METRNLSVRPERMGIVRKATAFRTQDRYQSADELLEALLRLPTFSDIPVYDAAFVQACSSFEENHDA